MIWFLLTYCVAYVVLSFPAVWAMGKLDKELTDDSEFRFVTAMFWPGYLFLTLVYQVEPMWNSIYLFIFPGEKENSG